MDQGDVVMGNTFRFVLFLAMKRVADRPRKAKFVQKKSKSGTTPYPRGASASAPPRGRKEGRQHRATRDQGGNDRGLNQPILDQQHDSHNHR
jgi:hypothetical protein